LLVSEQVGDGCSRVGPGQTTVQGNLDLSSRWEGVGQRTWGIDHNLVIGSSHSPCSSSAEGRNSGSAVLTSGGSGGGASGGCVGGTGGSSRGGGSSSVGGNRDDVGHNGAELDKNGDSSVEVVAEDGHRGSTILWSISWGDAGDCCSLAVQELSQVGLSRTIEANSDSSGSKEGHSSSV
jgi:hypothetical protein